MSSNNQNPNSFFDGLYDSNSCLFCKRFVVGQKSLSKEFERRVEVYKLAKSKVNSILFTFLKKIYLVLTN